MNAEATKTHPFEAVGLGKAPFRFLSSERCVGPIDMGGGLTVGAPGQPMGTCDYCGQGIANVFHVGSADGKRFKVGCDCIAKVDSGSLSRAVKVAVNASRKASKLESDARRIGEAKAALPNVSDILRSQPHFNESLAGRGLTMLDAVEWHFQHAGNAGRLWAARIVEKAQDGVQ